MVMWFSRASVSVSSRFLVPTSCWKSCWRLLLRVAILVFLGVL